MSGTTHPASVATSQGDPRSSLAHSATSPAGLVASGIRPIDYRLGGMLPGKPHVISGNPGTGKSLACLEFAQQGLERGEKVVLITQDEPADVLASAAFLGIDIDRPLRDDRLILLRYQSEFVKRLGRARSAHAVFDDLQRHLAPFKISRVAIDSIVPFLDGGAASAVAIAQLVGLLEELRVTSLLTFPGDMQGLYDRRIEPLLQRTGGVFHLTADRERNHQLEIRSVRFNAASTAPVTFRVLPGTGMVVITDTDASPSSVSEDIQRRLALVHMADALPNETIDRLRHRFEVDVHTGTAGTFSDLVSRGVGALLVEVRRDVLESALQLVRDLRKSNHTVPVVLVTPYVLRSADRTRALRAGADDFLSATMPPAELTARLRTIVKRGHWHDLTSSVAEPEVVLQPTSVNGKTYRPMTGDVLVKSVRGYLEREHLPFFTLFLIRGEHGDLAGLAKLALKIVRVESGDLVGVHGKQVIAYLDSARPKDLASVKTRMREQALRLGYGDIEIEPLGFPSNEEAVRSLIGAPL